MENPHRHLQVFILYTALRLNGHQCPFVELEKPVGEEAESTDGTI